MRKFSWFVKFKDCGNIQMDGGWRVKREGGK